MCSHRIANVILNFIYVYKDVFIMILYILLSYLDIPLISCKLYIGLIECPSIRFYFPQCRKQMSGPNSGRDRDSCPWVACVTSVGPQWGILFKTRGRGSRNIR